MTALRAHAERAIAERLGHTLDSGRHSILWSAEIASPLHAEPIVVTGQVDDFEENVEQVVASMAERLDGTVNRVDGMAETSKVIDGIRVVVWGVYDRDAFDVFARRLDTASRVRTAAKREDAGGEVTHVVS